MCIVKSNREIPENAEKGYQAMHTHFGHCTAYEILTKPVFMVVATKNPFTIAKYSVFEKWTAVLKVKRKFNMSVLFALMVAGQDVGYLCLSFVLITTFCQPLQFYFKYYNWCREQDPVKPY